MWLSSMCAPQYNTFSMETLKLFIDYDADRSKLNRQNQSFCSFMQ